MYVVAGLGNPGLIYRKSRHNAGFQALDALADALHIRVTKKGFSGIYGEGVHNGERIVLVKPQTYMNNSGECVQRILHFYKCDVSRLVVVYDDVELPVGALRIREKGSAGTHNGMRSIIANLGSEDFARVRVGVGDREAGELKDYVLGKPGKVEQAALEEVFGNAAEAVLMILDGRIGEAQARYNKRHIGGAAER